MNKSIYYFMLILLILILIFTSILLISDIKENFTTKLHNNVLSMDELISRLLSDKDFTKKLYDTIPTQTTGTSNNLLKLYDFDKSKYDDIYSINKSLDNLNSKLPEKYNKIRDEVNMLSARYNKNKNIMEEIIYKDKSYDLTEFNKKNLLLKEKIKNFRDLTQGSSVNPLEINKSNIVSLKNIENNNELMIERVQKDAFKNSLYKIKIDDDFLKYTSKYELIDKTCDNTTCLNDETCDTPCLKYKTIDTISTNSYEKDNLFYLVYITTNNEYNKHILESKTSVDKDLVYTKENIYPFYMLIPFNIKGHAINYNFNHLDSKKTISIKPIRNDKSQRFKHNLDNKGC